MLQSIVFLRIRYDLVTEQQQQLKTLNSVYKTNLRFLKGTETDESQPAKEQREEIYRYFYLKEN